MDISKEGGEKLTDEYSDMCNFTLEKSEAIVIDDLDWQITSRFYHERYDKIDIQIFVFIQSISRNVCKTKRLWNSIERSMQE